MVLACKVKSSASWSRDMNKITQREHKGDALAPGMFNYIDGHRNQKQWYGELLADKPKRKPLAKHHRGANTKR